MKVLVVDTDPVRLWKYQQLLKDHDTRFCTYLSGEAGAFNEDPTKHRMVIVEADLGAGVIPEGHILEGQPESGYSFATSFKRKESKKAIYVVVTSKDVSVGKQIEKHLQSVGYSAYLTDYQNTEEFIGAVIDEARRRGWDDEIEGEV